MDTASSGLSWRRWIIDHNPFFLLSAICMMLGCHVLNSALYTPAGDIGKLLILIAVVNVYEAALIGLGLALLQREGAERRDAHTLAGLESLFLADTTFVSGVIATIDARWGYLLGGLLAAMALAKIAVVARAMRLPMAGRIIALVGVQMLVILLTPAVLKQIAMRYEGFLPEAPVYLAWWAAGLVPVIGAVLLWPSRRERIDGASRPQLILAGIYLVVPFLSVLMHVYGSGWVYNFYLRWPEVSPVLLGVAVALSAVRAHRPGAPILKWQVLLVVIAMLCSLYGDVTPGKTHVRSSISFNVLGLHVTAVRMTLVAAVLVGLHLLWLRRPQWAVIAGAACAVAGVLWPNLPAILAALGRLARGTGSFVWGLAPKTAAQWGIACVAAAFVLLGAGAVYSFRRKPAPPAGEPAPEGAGPKEPEPVSIEPLGPTTA